GSYAKARGFPYTDSVADIATFFSLIEVSPKTPFFSTSALGVKVVLYPSLGNGAVKPFLLEVQVSLRPDTAGCITNRRGVIGRNVSSFLAIIVEPSTVAFFPTKIDVQACSIIIQSISYFEVFPSSLRLINKKSILNRILFQY